MRVGNRIINAQSPVFTIAEAGVNHNGDIDLAFKLIDVAAQAKADAVKFQAFKTEHLILSDVEKAPYQKETTGTTQSQFEMLKALEVTAESNRKLKAYAESQGLIFLTTPFDEVSLEELDELELPAYKIASTDLTNIPFLRRVAKRNRPVFLSTGMSYLSEVELALGCFEPTQVVLLQCSANYPLKDSEAELEVLNTYRTYFPDYVLGYSDHTVGLGASCYAVAMGAKVVEKHFTLEGMSDGPDHAASLSPGQLADWVAEIRKVERYLGTGVKKPLLCELATRASLQKSLVALSDIQEGDAFSAENVVAKRTGGAGISPIHWPELEGKTARRSFTKDSLIEL